VSADDQIPDPGMTQSYNRYLFCAGNPVSFIDASGHDWKSGIFGSITSTFGGAVGAVKSIGSGIRNTLGSAASAAKSAGKSIWKGIKNTDWGKVGKTAGYMVAGALMAGFAALCIAVVVAAVLPFILAATPFFGSTLFAWATGTSILTQGLFAASVAAGAGLIGGYSAAQNDESFDTLLRGSALMGMSIGSNIFTSAMYFAYLTQVIVFGTIGGIALGLDRLGVINDFDKDDYLNWTLGQEHRSQGTHGKRMRARPWFPGDDHVTGINSGGKGGISEDNSPLMALLDVMGVHGIGVVHDELCEQNQSKKGFAQDAGYMMTAADAYGTHGTNFGWQGEPWWR